MTTTNGGRAVLVVEDEPLVRIDIAMAFETAGFTVWEAATAQEALDTLCAETGIDLVFTDIEMPGRLNGLDLARIVKTRWPGLPVLVTSGRQRPDLPDTLFFPKPYDTGAIVSRARALSP